MVVTCSLEDAPKKMYFSLLEKKRKKSRDQKWFHVPEIKNDLSITLSGATWMTLIYIATQFAPLQFKKRHHTENSFFILILEVLLKLLQQVLNY